MAERKLGTEPELQIGRRIVVFIGPEGSGKSTIAQRIATASEKPYITTGGIFRQMAENDQTAYGDECRAMLAEHRYLKPEMLLPILVKRFSQDDVKDGFVLDGGLRMVDEVKGFKSVLQEAGREMPLTAIHLQIPGWVSGQRLIFSPDARKRDDDTVDGLLSRLSNFYNGLGQRASLIREQGWELVRIDAMGSIEENFNRVQEALRGKNKPIS